MSETGEDIFLIGQRAACFLAESVEARGLTWTEVLTACEACCASVVLNTVLAKTPPHGDDPVTMDNPALIDHLIALVCANANAIAQAALRHLIDHPEDGHAR